MIRLCGLAASNYYNEVKLALLEKRVPFDEQAVSLGQADRDASPLGKLPYLITDDGPLSESGAILAYIEAKYPERPLYPSDPYARARMHEITRYIELHLELVARKLYPEAFFGHEVDDAVKAQTLDKLERNVAAFAGLARFAPYIAGEAFTMADCAAAVHLPMVSHCIQFIYGRDVLAGLPMADYLKRVGVRPGVQKVNADRQASAAQVMARSF